MREMGIRFGIGGEVLVWGRRPVAKRGEWLSRVTKSPLLRMEDAFVRSIKPGWVEAPAGLVLDQSGIYFDQDNDLRKLLESGSRNHSDDIIEAQIERLKVNGISKYNAVPRGLWSKKDYVLVIDQVKGDASIVFGGASDDRFKAMLEAAKRDHPNSEILIRRHVAGQGYFDQSVTDDRVSFSDEAANPWDLLEGAKAVYCVTSHMGFEAIMAGHVPHVFGRPWYAGWGCSHDDVERPRRLTPFDLFDFAMHHYCHWFDAQGRSCGFDEMLDGMIAKVRHAHRYCDVQLHNIKPWKQPHLRAYFPKRGTKKQLRWGKRIHENEAILEDGFLRSRGLGAELVPPMSLVVDERGIYFDPSRESDLEALIGARTLSSYDQNRAAKLREKIVTLGLSKYNLAQAEAPKIPEGKEVILVVGQVEDDQSIIKGATGKIKTLDALLAEVRDCYPEAYLIYKPHPDVIAGLRTGVVASPCADLVYTGGSLEPLWPFIDRVATITSLVGFEALMRGKTVEVFGQPFYAGWGLTRDHAPPTGRRKPVDLTTLIHATLIDYPIYFDPVFKTISTPEVIVKRLAEGYRPSLAYRLGARVQRGYYRIKAKTQRG